MNYGKTAYLKILDIEKELNTQKNVQTNLNYFEVTKPNINYNISYSDFYITEFENISLEKNKEVCFQITICAQSSNTSEVLFELLTNDNIIHSQTKIIYNLESDSIILKTYTPITTSTTTLSLKVTNLTENTIINIKEISTIIIGASNEIINSGIELRALEDTINNKVLISYIDNKELYYYFSPLEVKNLQSDQFKFLSPAKSHCFCYDKNSDTKTESDIYLFRVAPNGNLYYSKIFKQNNELLIDIETETVYAVTCPENTDELIFITYIKNGRCYYKTLRNSGISEAKELPLPLGNYKDVRVACSSNSEHIYVIATHENGSNYICHSLVLVSTGKISEFLYTDLTYTIKKYIDFSQFENLSIEHIKSSFEYSAKSISYLNSIIENLSKEHIQVDSTLSTKPFIIQEKTTYGVKLDKSILTGIEWGSYTDDAVNFEGAYMDFDNDKFVDNGWINRWPFNQIKPCLMKNEKVVGYLDPNNYSKFEDGTDSNINNLTLEENAFVMIEIPKIYYQISRDDNYIYIKISNKEQDGFVCKAHTYKGVELDKLYISAYLNGISAGTTLDTSLGFITPSGSTLSKQIAINYTNFWSKVQEHHGERYEMLPFNITILIGCLYAIMFKNTNSQKSLGFGYSSKQDTHIVGLLDQKGMYYGKNVYGTGVKFLGIEDLCGTREQVCTGFYVRKSIPRFIDVSDPNSSYSPDYIENYLSSDKEFVLATKYARSTLDVNEDATNIGFWGREIGTNFNQGFCDALYLTTSCGGTTLNSSLYGVYSTNLNNGIFTHALTTTSNTSKSRSLRIVYYPTS